MSEACERYRKAAVENVLSRDAKSSVADRRAAFDDTDAAPARALVATVAKNAWKVTAEDVAAAKTSLTEDQVFEIVVVTAMGQATRQLDSARAAIRALAATTGATEEKNT